MTTTLYINPRIAQAHADACERIVIASWRRRTVWTPVLRDAERTADAMLRLDAALRYAR